MARELSEKSLKKIPAKKILIEKTKRKIIKLCKNPKVVKIKGPDGSKKPCYSVRWYNKAKKLTLRNRWNAQYVVGTLLKAQERGLVGVEIRIAGKPAILKIEKAIVVFKAI